MVKASNFDANNERSLLVLLQGEHVPGNARMFVLCGDEHAVTVPFVPL